MRYIVEIANGVLGSLGSDVEKLRDIIVRLPALADELGQLRTLDFLPDGRNEFFLVRVELRRFSDTWIGRPGEFLNDRSGRSQQQLRELMNRLIAVIDKHGGEGWWRSKTRSFPFVKDKVLREIIERDYKELSLVLFPGGAWKSTVIIAGSILEAIVFDVLASDATRKTKAKASAKAPSGAMEKWTLEKLIAVAADIGVIPPGRADTFDQVLRDYRNFVHPSVEIRSGHPCREGEAQLAIGGLNAVCDVLEGLPR